MGAAQRAKVPLAALAHLAHLASLELPGCDGGRRTAGQPTLARSASAAAGPPGRPVPADHGAAPAGGRLLLRRQLARPGCSALLPPARAAAAAELEPDPRRMPRRLRLGCTAIHCCVAVAPPVDWRSLGGLAALRELALSHCRIWRLPGTLPQLAALTGLRPLTRLRELDLTGVLRQKQPRCRRLRGGIRWRSSAEPAAATYAWGGGGAGTVLPSS